MTLASGEVVRLEEVLSGVGGVGAGRREALTVKSLRAKCQRRGRSRQRRLSSPALSSLERFANSQVFRTVNTPARDVGVVDERIASFVEERRSRHLRR